MTFGSPVMKYTDVGVRAPRPPLLPPEHSYQCSWGLTVPRLESPLAVVTDQQQPAALSHREPWYVRDMICDL